MKAINQKALQPALPRAGSWYMALAVSIVFTACGAKSQQNGNSQEPSSGGAAALGGGSALSGGAESSGTRANASGGAESGGTRANASGGVTVQASGATGDAGEDDGGQANSCDLTLMSDAVRLAAIGSGPGNCFISKDPAAHPNQPWGAIIIDGEGRVVAATGGAQTIVNKLTGERWQCYAGTTFLYWCSTFE
jgi:hypothetical protein